MSIRPSLALVGLATPLLAAGLLAAPAAAGSSDGARSPFGQVAGPNIKSPGLTSPDVLGAGVADLVRAQGSMPVENPQNGVGYYGYDSIDNSPTLMPHFEGSTVVEAHKTEPDKNTYLVLSGQTGPDTTYDYGTHFLFQGHETGSPGYVTRVNLDADAKHRVTILASTDVAGAPLPNFDGSTWNPYSKQLLLTSENGCDGGVWAGRAAYGSSSTFAEMPALGKGGFEGVQVAPNGSVWLVEDTGGSTAVDGSGNSTHAKYANSYVYRFTPAAKGDLRTGTLQALQILRANGTPMDTASSVTSADLEALHTKGTSYRTRWVTVHTTTAANLTETFCATDAAKAAGATPLKRPENGVFRPGTNFREFYFTETGDTNADSIANGTYGGWGAVLRITQASAGAGTGRINVVKNGDQAHTGLDNLAFASANHLLVVEDAGDTLHTQRNALDSGYVLDVGAATWSRFLAEGRDPSATLDSGFLDAGTPGFANDGDNEITGIHVSDGDPTAAGLLGAKIPTPFRTGWRIFWTQQHGDNVTYEMVRS